jgi:hypothetical protein
MRGRFSMICLMAAMALMCVACGGGGTPQPPPDDFTRMAAQVLDSAGLPVSGLAVRVEGNITGVTTDASGNFILGRSAFPNGIEALNEISVGRNGVILGAASFIPRDNKELVLRFGDNFGLSDPGGPTDPPDPDAEPGSLSGNIFDETTEEPLDGVEVTLFSPAGELLMTESEAGFYEFATVAPGDWRLTAFLAGYNPEAAAVSIPEGTDVVQHLSMVPDGQVAPGDGLKVRGTLTDADTGAPIAGATVTMMADTGYLGMPEPGFIDDMDYWVEPDGTAPPSGGDGWDESPPGGMEGGKDSSMAPWSYDPQYQETTTEADGSFEFENEVVAYGLWFEYYAEGYLNGSHYEDAYGLTGELVLELTLEPYVSTSISGRVTDEHGTPIEGAYVEFIFAGGSDAIFGGMAVPGAIGLEEMAEQSDEAFESFASPPPPSTAGGTDGRGDWGDWAENSAPMMDGAGGTEGGGYGADNPMMQRFRWENRNQEHGTSDVGYFTGFYGTNTDEEGNFGFEDVPAGPYYVFASAYRHLPYDTMYQVLEDAEENYFEIVLQQQPVGAVEGVITDEGGNPLPDVLVTCTQPNVDPFSYTDESGYYLIDNVPVGMWLISGYISGYLTVTRETAITENVVATVNLTLESYVPPTPTTLMYGGHVVDGTDNSGVSGADIVFTPVNNEYGGWYQHVLSGANGAYSAVLIPTEYNVLIQCEGYEDLYMRIWLDVGMRTNQMDFWLWPIGGGSGPWGGGPVPLMDAAGGMPERGGDF